MTGLRISKVRHMPEGSPYRFYFRGVRHTGAFRLLLDSYRTRPPTASPTDCHAERAILLDIELLEIPNVRDLWAKKSENAFELIDLKLNLYSALACELNGRDVCVRQGSV